MRFFLFLFIAALTFSGCASDDSNTTEDCGIQFPITSIPMYFLLIDSDTQQNLITNGSWEQQDVTVIDNQTGETHYYEFASVGETGDDWEDYLSFETADTAGTYSYTVKKNGQAAFTVNVTLGYRQVICYETLAIENLEIPGITFSKYQPNDQFVSYYKLIL